MALRTLLTQLSTLNRFALALILLFALAGVSVGQTCEATCDAAEQKCKEEASAIYITCGQQGGTETQCQQKKKDYLKTCGCGICYCGGDWRAGSLGISYYCRCGAPIGCPREEVDCVLTYDATCDVATPILIDRDGNGIRLTALEAGVVFPLKGTGSSVKSSWTEAGSDDSWLGLDRNNNGVIDDGTELFGNYTLQPESNHKNGFLALAEFDKSENGGNSDGVISAADSVFSRLRLWRDANHNGVSEPGELSTLTSAGIEEISLDYAQTLRKDQFGNLFRYRAKVNGSRSAWDVLLLHRDN